MKKGNPIALLPIGVFLVIYLGLGLLFEYGMGIEMGFYNIPIVIAFLVAILVACLQNKALSFDEKLTIMGQGNVSLAVVSLLHRTISDFPSGPGKWFRESFTQNDAKKYIDWVKNNKDSYKLRSLTPFDLFSLPILRFRADNDETMLENPQQN